ncbi:hypothetical protein An13g02840 [Aspergillus niger]|uniref:Uncharacterized protein n=2 Tax=Aspergillus niger TaxID=5061 RepID=A2R1Y0_ASPNC|nr:hypothetical protein An13g02840 [Aspergillus niger]CAK41680.1 hypothetical protein An13g02840 [Aspergillus niger]
MGNRKIYMAIRAVFVDVDASLSPLRQAAQRLYQTMYPWSSDDSAGEYCNRYSEELALARYTRVTTLQVLVNRQDPDPREGEKIKVRTQNQTVTAEFELRESLKVLFRGKIVVAETGEVYAKTEDRSLGERSPRIGCIREQYRTVGPQAIHAAIWAVSTFDFEN